MAKGTRFVVAGDNHGDMGDPVSRKALMGFIRDYRPTLRVHSGDNWDFRNLRRGASDDEKAHSLQDDWEAGAEFLREFFEGAVTGFYLRGNHCERVWKFAESASGLLRDYACDGIKRIEALVKRAKASMLPYDSRLGVLDVGKLRVVHGYACGVGAAAKHARVYNNCLFGHTHTMDVAPVENVDGPAEARGVGCICKIDMGYNAAQMNKLRHQQGWVYGVLFPNGTYQLFQTKRIGDQFYAATDIKTY